MSTTDAQVAELLPVAQRRQRKPSPDKPPEPRPTSVGDAKQAFEGRPKTPKKRAPKQREKKPVRPTGRKPLPPHLEAEEHALRPEGCGECGSTALDVADELVEETRERSRLSAVARTPVCGWIPRVRP